MNLRKRCSQGRGHLWPQGHNLNTFGRGNGTRLIHVPNIKEFSCLNPSKTSGPGPGNFWPYGYRLKNFERGPQGEGMNQILKARALLFQTRRSF